MKRLIPILLVIALLLPAVPAIAAEETETALPDDAVITDTAPAQKASDLSETGDPDPDPDPDPEPDPEPAIPEITRAVPAVDGTKLTWSPYEGAAQYVAFIKKADNSGWKRIGTSTTTSLVHKNPVSGTLYTYTVRAADENGAYISGYNKEGFSVTYYAPPVLKKPESIYGGQRISWEPREGAAGYKVYLKENGSWKALGQSASTSFVNKNVVSGSSYTYTVRCWNPDDDTAQSYYDRKGATGAYVAAPAISSFTPVSGGTKVGWKTVSGAVMYRLFFKTSSGWKKIADSAGTSYIHSSLTAGVTYTYTIRAIDQNGKYISGYNAAGWKFKYINPIAVTGVSAVAGGTRLSWMAESTAAGYRVYRRPFGGSWASIGTTDTANFTDTTAKKNTLYGYTLRTLDSSGKATSYYLNDTPYCYNSALASGKITVNGASVTFANGYPCSGYVTIDGKMYYYNADGVIQKNGLVGSKSEGYRYADKNGVIQLDYTGIAKNAKGNWYLKNGVLDFTYRDGVTVSGVKWNVLNGKAYKVTTEEDKTMYRALKLVSKVCDKSMTKAQKMRKMFSYFKTSYGEYNPRIPHNHDTGWHITYANDILVGGGGNCMSYGAAFAFVAKAIGCGRCYACNSGGHGWAEADGLVYDPEWDMHHGNFTYYAVSYNYNGDVNYRAGISAGYAWMRVEIYKGR